MPPEQFESLGFASRLLRKQQALAKHRFQFTLGSLAISTGFVACFIWLVQFMVRNQPLGIPFPMHLWMLALWISVIGGAVISEDARTYLVAGLIGLALASPILLGIYMRDFAAIPLITGWSCSFAFAIFANVGGAISCFLQDRSLMAGMHVAVFGFSVVLLASHFAA